MKTFPILIIISLLVFACNNKNRSESIEIKNDAEYHINFENCLENSKSLKISEIADTIKYIKLLTPREIIITSIRRVEIAKPYIYIISSGVAYQFKLNGQFVKQIGKIGKGPGEYTNGAENIFIDSTRQEILVNSYPQLFFYDMEGNYLRSVKLMSFCATASDSIIYAANITRGIEKFRLVGFNHKMDTLVKLKNYEIWGSKERTNVMVTSKILNPFYYYNSNLYFKGFQDYDSIWEIKGTSVKLHATINMGKFKLPIESRPDYNYENFIKNAEKHYSIPAILEDDRFFYLTAQSWWNDKLPVLKIIYEKESEKGYDSRFEKLAGFKDDILNGPPFWPLTITEDYYVSAIEAEELLNSIDPAEVYPKSFKTLISTINENTNQLLILAKKKAGK